MTCVEHTQKMSPPHRHKYKIPSIHDLYKPLLNVIEAVSNYFYQRQALFTPVLPEEVVVQGFPTVHQVKDSGLSCQTLPLLQSHKRTRVKILKFSDIPDFGVFLKKKKPATNLIFCEHSQTQFSQNIYLSRGENRVINITVPHCYL